MENQIKRVKRTLMHKGAIVDFYSDTMEMPDGRQVEWDLIHHRRGAAAVVPVMDDGKILMVRQFRNALDRITLEIPAGARDSVEEETICCAKRELEEETGYHSDDLEFLISLRTTVAYCDEFIDVYVARNLSASHQNLDEDEYVELEAYDLDTLCEMIYAGTIQDAKTVASLMAYKNKAGIK
ncbi:MAG: NUDIX hydrolase [bacterium]|nr:NUDIX hydrolase [bacterium]